MLLLRFMDQSPLNHLEVDRLKRYFKRLFNTSIFIFSMGVLLLILIFFSTCFVYVKPYEYGVKQVNIGLKRGIQEKVYQTGLYFVTPLGFEEMHIFPKNIQVFDLTKSPKTNVSRFEKAAHIQTSDGFFVDVDVSILYQITDPLKVIHTIGPGKLYEDNGLIPKAEPVLKDTLGKLTTEEFYNSTKRVEKMLQAQQKLDSELSSKGIRIKNILIRYFEYSPEIQKNIEEKKLKDQMVFKNQAEAKAEAQKAILAKVQEEGQAQYNIALQKGRAYVVKKNADRDLYVRRKKANANLLVKLAEAEKTRLKNNALRVIGAENLVGLKMADVLKGVDLIVLPSDGKDGFNPLNLNKVTGLFD